MVSISSLLVLAWGVALYKICASDGRFHHAGAEQFISEKRTHLGILSSMDPLSADGATMLVLPFTEDEVWRVISISDGDKAPALNAFNLNFYDRGGYEIQEQHLLFRSMLQGNYT
ncbi:hypothetical protein GOBAR_AA29213 [Gossypium barbadense]|uniref:Uncharacterized protein n=1 Tax=Gossypium barbadense TaxID=3634 RepID=A0A2P5WK51_GOSBA|nr:hypothetical protein GOBAR_AA29213 [Gossypium barbadense]